MSYGYRVYEVPLAPLGALKGIKILRFRCRFRAFRPPVGISAGCEVSGVVRPHPDPSCSISLLAGAFKRIGAEPPQRCRSLVRGLRRFVSRFVRMHFRPLDANDDLSFETWIAQTRYPQWRKMQLIKVYSEMIGDPKTSCSSFEKDESYDDFKYPRTINSRDDQFKVYSGPIFHAIEKIVFEYEAFIKHIPVSQRPEYIRELLDCEGVKFLATDFSSFENSFSADIINSVECQLYDFMTSGLAQGKEFMAQVRKALTGQNTCHFSDLSITVPATRMSGDMCTSLGNGFTNLMLILFLSERNHCEVKCVVEGDDAVIRFRDIDTHPTENDFAKLGFTIVLQSHTILDEASFCGLVTVDDVNIPDPYRVLAQISWLPMRYVGVNDRKRKALLRCKALSVLATYPGCPVLQNLSLWILRHTSDVSHYDMLKLINSDQTMGVWLREQYLYALFNSPFIKPINMNSRLLMERKFGMSVEVQFAYEKFFKGSFGPIPDYGGFPEVWHSFCADFVIGGYAREPGGPDALRFVQHLVSLIPDGVSALRVQNGVRQFEAWRT